MIRYNKDEGTKIYTYLDAEELLDNSGFTRILIEMLLICSNLESDKSFWRLRKGAGMIGFNCNDSIIVRVYMNLTDYSSQDTVTIGKYKPYPAAFNKPADILFEYDKFTHNITVSTNDEVYHYISPHDYLVELTNVFKDIGIVSYNDFRSSWLLEDKDSSDHYANKKSISIIENSKFAPTLMCLIATAKQLEPKEIWYYMNQCEAVCVCNNIRNIMVYIYLLPPSYENIEEDKCGIVDATNKSSVPEEFYSSAQIRIIYNVTNSKVEIYTKKNLDGIVDRLTHLKDRMNESDLKIFKFSDILFKEV